MTALPLMAEVAGLDVTPRPPTASHRAHFAPARQGKKEITTHRWMSYRPVRCGFAHRLP